GAVVRSAWRTWLAVSSSSSSRSSRPTSGRGGGSSCLVLTVGQRYVTPPGSTPRPGDPPRRCFRLAPDAGYTHVWQRPTSPPRGRSSILELKLPKLTARVRFPSPAPPRRPGPRARGDVLFFAASLLGAQDGAPGPVLRLVDLAGSEPPGRRPFTGRPAGDRKSVGEGPRALRGWS